jgi:hypothetical protein
MSDPADLSRRALLGLQDWFGLTPAVLSHVYDQVNPSSRHQDALVYYVPAGLRWPHLFFLPATNAKRRRSPIRFLVFLANLAVIFPLQAARPSRDRRLAGRLCSRSPAPGACGCRAVTAAGATPQRSSAKRSQAQSRPGSQPQRAARPDPSSWRRVRRWSSAPPRRHRPQQARCPPWSGTVPAPGSAGASAATAGAAAARGWANAPSAFRALHRSFPVSDVLNLNIPNSLLLKGGFLMHGVVLQNRMFGRPPRAACIPENPGRS